MQSDTKSARQFFINLVLNYPRYVRRRWMGEILRYSLVGEEGVPVGLPFSVVRQAYPDPEQVYWHACLIMTELELFHGYRANALQKTGFVIVDGDESHTIFQPRFVAEPVRRVEWDPFFGCMLESV